MPCGKAGGAGGGEVPRPQVEHLLMETISIRHSALSTGSSQSAGNIQMSWYWLHQIPDRYHRKWRHTLLPHIRRVAPHPSSPYKTCGATPIFPHTRRVASHTSSPYKACGATPFFPTQGVWRHTLISHLRRVAPHPSSPYKACGATPSFSIQGVWCHT